MVELGFHGEAAEVSVVGDLDITTASTLDEMLALTLGKRPSHVVLDLSQADFLDCAAARAIAGAAQSMPAGHRLTIQNPALAVRRLLQLTGLAGLIESGVPARVLTMRADARGVVLPARSDLDPPTLDPPTLDPPALVVTAVWEGPVCALTVTGSLDITTVDGFRTQATEATGDLVRQAERLVLDLAELDFLDCAGARALAALTGAVPPSCPVIVRSLSPAAARTLRLTGLNLERSRQEDTMCDPSEELAQQAQLARARMTEVFTSIRETATRAASANDHLAATFSRLAAQRPYDANRLSALSASAQDLASQNRRWARHPL
ncbi:MAG TPA: STAS domain-containing protein [Streptosporangiaceae bacterium]|nr:STAS domain-containing protein [Streptosporangiaceae bacterium]